MKEYLARREVAQRINNRVPSNYPCRNCTTGLCCKCPDVYVTVGDAKLIIEGAMSKTIPDSVRRRAIRQASNSNFEYCAFFGGESEKHCMIYNQRPLTCMIYGFSGIPKDREAIDRAAHTSIVLGKDMGMSVFDLNGLYLCRDAFNALASKSGRLPFNNLLNVTLQRGYIGALEVPRQKLGMREFLLLILADARLANRTLRSDKFPPLPKK